MRTIVKPLWVEIALNYLGQKEIPGKKTAPFIEKALVLMGAWWRDDETPWCGVGLGAVIRMAELNPPKAYYRARAWLDWGKKLALPAYGCVVIFERGGAGHVGLVVGVDTRNRLMVLGGNQSNAVTIAPFDPSRVLGYRWPLDTHYPLQYNLPKYGEGLGASSKNEK
ncbi:TIGR02594 family protein [Methylocaldum sp.]|uniref:TIGR02594 family protein n=1 Tax=Methylocaldum sp. TaxID=1969727 RepID=UPI002D335A07|nr:TIGR02594 family protein [Methylocaldum sp.]HYE38156.1 TIGR02594 family protein [Methylocaldum sp.]